jgi:hypothetical protein
LEAPVIIAVEPLKANIVGSFLSPVSRLPQSDRASAADFPLCSEKAAARILVYNTTPRERPFLIDLDQTRIAGDIGREDRRDSANHDRGMRFAADSLLEGDGFELPVPGASGEADAILPVKDRPR